MTAERRASLSAGLNLVARMTTWRGTAVVCAPTFRTLQQQTPTYASRSSP